MSQKRFLLFIIAVVGVSIFTVGGVYIYTKLVPIETSESVVTRQPTDLPVDEDTRTEEGVGAPESESKSTTKKIEEKVVPPTAVVSQKKFNTALYQYQFFAEIANQLINRLK